MNFKNFLSNSKMLQESYQTDATQNVVLGYGTCKPFHVGYLPMVAEMVKISEQSGAEPIFILLRDDTTTEQELATILESLAHHFSCVKIVVERSIPQSLMRLHEFDRAPSHFLGDSVLVNKAKAAAEVLYGKDIQIPHHPGYLSEMQRICTQAAQGNDFVTYRSYLIDTDVTAAMRTFEQLKEVYGQQ